MQEETEGSWDLAVRQVSLNYKDLDSEKFSFSENNVESARGTHI